jgi:hypothetical protein
LRESGVLFVSIEDGQFEGLGGRHDEGEDSSRHAGGDVADVEVSRVERRFIFVVVGRRRDFRQFKLVPRTNIK